MLNLPMSAQRTSARCRTGASARATAPMRTSTPS
jgi:hypothetical protein